MTRISSIFSVVSFRFLRCGETCEKSSPFPGDFTVVRKVVHAGA